MRKSKFIVIISAILVILVLLSVFVYLGFNGSPSVYYNAVFI